MSKNTAIKLLILTFITAVFTTNAQVIFSEKFNSSIINIKKHGWTVPGGCKIVKLNSQKCLKVECPAFSRSMVQRMVEVVPGKRYTVKCKIKTENVTAKAGKRGATIFAQLHDKNKAYIPGGTFPLGIMGTKDWQEFEIPFSSLIPESVAYLNIFVGIEGRGQAWFKDLQVEEFKDYLPINLIYPENSSKVNNSLPDFKWEAVKRTCQLVIAANKAMTKKRKVFNVGKKSNLKILEPLAEGKWYWQVQETSRAHLIKDVHLSKVQSFTISANARQWPVIVKAHYRWTKVPKPVLSVKIAGPDKLRTSITIDNEKAEIVSFENKMLKFRPVQNLLPGLHKIVFTFVNEQGEKCQIQNFYSNNVPSSKVSWKEGITYVDGKAFFPIGTYRDPSDNYLEFSGIKEAGFNMTHSYIFENYSGDSIIQKAQKYLDAAQKNKVKVFLGIPTKWIKKFNAPNIANYVAKLSDKRALLTWYLADEPVYRKLGLNNLHNTNKLVKQIDPFHPTSIVFASVMASRSLLMSKYKETADIIGSDPYPVYNGKGSYITVETWTKNCRYQAGPERPVWCVIETFDNDYVSGHKKHRKFTKSAPVVKPTYNELKNQCFMALSAGADGIIFYWLPSGKRHYNLREDAPAVWRSLCKVVKELHAVESFMTTPRSRTRLSFKVPKPFRVWIRSNKKGETAIAFINPLGKTQSLRVKLPLNTKKLYNADGKIISYENNLYESNLAPYEVKNYIIK